MRTLLIIGFIALLNILTCCQPEKSSELVVDINIPDPPASENLSSLIDSYEIISLDNNPDAYIENPSRTILCDSLFLIKNESNQSILIFNYLGRYIKSISKRGRGPNEYLYITDFTYNPTENSVSIYDNDKIKKYSLDGEFISEIKLGLRPNKATRIDLNHTIIEKVMPTGDSISDFYIRLVDNDFKTKSARLPLKPLTGPGFGTEGQNFRTSINGDHAYFFSYFGDTVYHINSQSIKPAFAFKYKRKIITVTNGTGNYDVDPNEALRYLSFFEIGDLNLLYYSFKNIGYCFVFNTSNNNSKLYKSTFLIRDSFNNQASLLIDAMSLDRFIELNDPEKKKCQNLTVLNAALKDQIKGFQCIIKIKFSEL
jgi:hypothetical protein